jgi:integrase
MPTGQINLTAVKSLPPGATLWDRAVRGFGVRCQHDAASYVIKYRIAGRQRMYTIGRHGSPWTPDLARKEALRLLSLVVSGTDPADAKASAALAAAQTFRAVADRYLAAMRARQKPRALQDTNRYLLRSFRPLHPMPIGSIERSHITARVAELERTCGATSALRARSTLSAMFSWAIREGYKLPANPVSGTNKPQAAPARERVLTDSELRAIWLACGDNDYGRIVRLLMLTGQRREEIGALRWSEITGDAVTFPASRTKNGREHCIPLSPAALALLPAPVADRDFLFGHRPISGVVRGFTGWAWSKCALDERIAQAEGRALPDWRLHDLRRTCATGLGELGVLPHVVETILNHISGHRAGVAGVYQRARYSAEVRHALTRWSDHIERLVHD